MVPRGKGCSDFRSLSYVWSLPRTCPFWFLSQFLTLDYLLPPDTLHSLFPSLFCTRHASGAALTAPASGWCGRYSLPFQSLRTLAGVRLLLTLTQSSLFHPFLNLLLLWTRAINHLRPHSLVLKIGTWDPGQIVYVSSRIGEVIWEMQFGCQESGISRTLWWFLRITEESIRNRKVLLLSPKQLGGHLHQKGLSKLLRLLLCFGLWDTWGFCPLRLKSVATSFHVLISPVLGDFCQ